MIAETKTDYLTKTLNDRLSELEIIVNNLFNVEQREELRITPLDPESNFGKLSLRYNLSYEEELLIIIAYAWEYKPLIFEPFIKAFKDLKFKSIFGGYLEKERQFFIPSVQTVIKLLFHDEVERNDFYLKVIDPTYHLVKNGVIEWVDYIDTTKSIFNKGIRLSLSFQEYILGGGEPRLDHETDFPARLIDTKASFEDVVLNKKTKEDIEPFEKLLSIRPKLTEYPDLSSKINTNQIVVFTGSPGTGKSFTATTIGKKYGMPTYRLDISKVVSKYIGEFEKAMEKVFNRLDDHNCILFIDEADAIFSKRTENVSDVKEKYANQEMSYLLQRIETFNGVVVLASNVQDIRSHVDKAMLRRISYIIEFPFPLEEERKVLWENAFPSQYTISSELISDLARNYQLSGANIKSVSTQVLIELLADNVTDISFEKIEPALKREFFKRDSTYSKCIDQSPGAILMEQRLGRSSVHTGRRM
ncbi:ATP-binding protein [Flammeovirga sp. MY04]|uniref:ATP-binding protein n=1 Tax=Flammeovirga sp. MY04 TaxID=1191459 RepID=UPI0008061055|nr:ATP-binding protein [Flammeovirga sp. MY04]ANQ50153.1 ATP-binding protein [Flammeovirga sp. MY04]